MPNSSTIQIRHAKCPTHELPTHFIARALLFVIGLHKYSWTIQIRNEKCPSRQRYKYDMPNAQLINDKNTTCQMPNSWTSKIFHRSNSFIRHWPAQVLMNNTKDKCPTHQRYKYDMPNAQLMNVSNAQLMNSFSRHWLAQMDVISTGNGSM